MEAGSVLVVADDLAKIVNAECKGALVAEGSSSVINVPPLRRKP
jgi:hypothetical protein